MILFWHRCAGLVLMAHFSAFASPDARESAYRGMSAESRQMQDDLSINPAMLWALEGEVLWSSQDNPPRKACAACHGDVRRAMKGVSATFPKLIRGQLVNLDAQVNQCRERYQQLSALDPESKPLLALTTLLSLQSRGMPIRMQSSPEVERAVVQGQALYFQRMGQLNLSCAQCHDDRAGLRLGGSVIPQGHPTGYPIYRIEWQAVGSLQRRVRNCMAGVRAERYAFGSEELLSLEAYLMRRAQGMMIESPGVRP